MSIGAEFKGMFFVLYACLGKALLYANLLMR